jgi:abhydrolase domain-containing protein 17
MNTGSVWRFTRIPIFFALGAALFAMIGPRRLAERMLYFPDYASRRTVEGVQFVTDENGHRIAVLHLPNPSARSTVWFFHGNAEDLGDLEPFLIQLRQAGFAVLAHDYPGYGLSTGRPSEAALNTASRAVRRFLREQLGVPPAQTLLFGRSLGGGPAMQMAVEENVGGVVLQSTFTSVFRVMTRWRLFPGDLFENERKLAQVAAPVLILHGRRDEVIPFHHGQALYAAAREPKRAWFLHDTGHNDFNLRAGGDFWLQLREFAALCEQHAAGRKSP